MTLLVALKPIPGTVQIEAGQTFHEMNADQADHWIRSGHARAPAPKNVRGWNGLDWVGGEVAVIASGPSLSVEQCEAVRAWRDVAPNRYAVVVNTSFRRALWADVLYACDGPWWTAREQQNGETYLEEARATFAGQLWTQDREAATANKLHHIQSQTGKQGIEQRPGLINQGFNGGFQAVGLAFQAGAATAYLLGFDMRGGHWHKNHPGSLNKKNRYDVFIKAFEEAAAKMPPGFAIVNCTPNSALKCFPERDWQEVFA